MNPLPTSREAWLNEIEGALRDAAELDELAKEFVAHNYDLKFLMRAIVHTQAYQRSSEPAGKGTSDDLLLFARMPVRGMSPEQFFDSLLEATDYLLPPNNQNINRGFPFNQQAGPRGDFLAKFASQDRRNETQTSILQALFMMNGKFLEARTKFYPNMTMEKVFELQEGRRKGMTVEENVPMHTLALQNTPTAHDHHLITERQGIHPIVSNDNCRNTQSPKQLHQFRTDVAASSLIQGRKRLVQK